MAAEIAPPSGTVTFLFTDVEGSTRLWEEHPGAMSVALERHDAIVRGAVEGSGGYVFATAGDSFAAAFGRVSDGVEAALAAQAALEDQDWPEGISLRVRMGLHVGEAHERAGDYFGSAVNRAARVMAAAHGGQVVGTSAVAASDLEGQWQTLGVHRLKDLQAPDELYQLSAGSFPPLRSLDAALHNLPVQRTDLLGRKDDISSVVDLVEQQRLVTLTGAGGAGKTRLAMAVGGELAGRFSDGVWFVDLAPLLDGGLIAETAVRAAGLPTDRLAAAGDAAGEVAASMISGSEMLLVLDNCEHLIDDAADFVEAVLESGSAARILATSREIPDVEGEHSFRVPTLDVDDDAGGAAVELFVRQAAAAGVEVDPSDPAVTSICRRLDGLPLAIELAAAQVAVMRPADLESRLDERFELLVAGRGRRRQRHQHNLRAVLESSWDLLDAPQRAALAQLSVFAGGWTLEAAEAVCRGAGSVPLVLRELLAKSLVEEVGDATASRFRMLETVKLYAAEQLAAANQEPAIRDRHLEWLLDWSGHRQLGEYVCHQDWRDQYIGELDNVRVAIRWALDNHRADAAARLIVAGFLAFWEGWVASEVSPWTEETLAASHPPLTELLFVDVLVAFLTAQHSQMAPRAEVAIAAASEAGRDDVVAAALAFQGFVTAPIDPAVALGMLETAGERAQQAGDRHLHALATTWTAVVHVVNDDFELALAACEQAQQLDPVSHSINGHHNAWIRGFALLGAGQPEQAREAFALAGARMRYRDTAVGTFTNSYRLMDALVAAAQRDWATVRARLDDAVQRADHGTGLTFVGDVAIAAAELLEQLNTGAARELTAALHRQPFSTPLYYNRYRRLRERLEPTTRPETRLTPQQLHKLATQLLDDNAT